MNFWEMISKGISILFIFTLVFITLFVLKYYLYSFIYILKKSLKIFLEVVSTKDEGILVNDRIFIKKILSIGNEINNDIVLKDFGNNLTRVFILIEGNKIYIHNLNNTKNVKVNDENIMGKVRLKRDDIIHILNTSFKLIIEWWWLSNDWE